MNIKTIINKIKSIIKVIKEDPEYTNIGTEFKQDFNKYSEDVKSSINDYKQQKGQMEIDDKDIVEIKGSHLQEGEQVKIIYVGEERKGFTYYLVLLYGGAYTIKFGIFIVTSIFKFIF